MGRQGQQQQRRSRAVSGELQVELALVVQFNKRLKAHMFSSLQASPDANALCWPAEVPDRRRTICLSRSPGVVLHSHLV